MYLRFICLEFVDMRNRILEIVVFLMDFMREHSERQPAPDDISLELKDMGYSDTEINTAYSWFLEQFNSSIEEYYTDFPDNANSIRVLTEEERQQLSSESYGFLLKFLNNRIVDSEQFEAILERVLLLTGEAIDVDRMKIIVSSVLFKEIEQGDVGMFFDSLTEQSTFFH